MHPLEYDLVVIGSGPAGQKAAICAAKLRKKVTVVDRSSMIGGVCIHKGTIPSKTLREAILHLTGFMYWRVYGKDYSLSENISVRDLVSRVQTMGTPGLSLLSPTPIRGARDYADSFFYWRWS